MAPDKPIKVLMVDDDPLVLAATARALRRYGIMATCANSPFGVSALVRKEPPDVLVLDYHMPGLDGAHLVRVLRSSPRTADIPVVFYSGDCDELLISTATALGAHYAIKGINPRILVDAILAALRGDGAVAHAV
jgi:DNA-binding response OmpR family regulator